LSGTKPVFENEKGRLREDKETANLRIGKGGDGV
jgi:hypothetical protein